MNSKRCQFTLFVVRLTLITACTGLVAAPTDNSAAQIQGYGVPPLRELAEFLHGRQVRISV